MGVVSRIFRRIRQLGGIRLLKGYVSLGVLWKVLRAVFPGILFKPYNAVHARVLDIVAPALKKKYGGVLSDVMSKYESAVAREERSNIVWVCWLQGRDAAPALVKSCISSLERNLPGRDIRVLDEEGIGRYVRFPEHIERKWGKGLIPPAAYSDLLRLELLIKYGGTWIDSTVFCSGPDYPPEYLDAGLFMFQFARAEDRRYSGISNWFITSSRPGNPVLMVLRDMLYRYWEDFDCFVYFFVFHLFFSMIVEREPRIAEDMPYGYSPACHFLQRHLGDAFNEADWRELTSKVAFHKLTYRLGEYILADKGNYFARLLEMK